MEFIVGHFNYWIVIILMMTGLYVVISTGNLVKKLVGLGMFQTSVFQLYITMSKVSGGQPPILVDMPEHGAVPAAHGAQEMVEHAGELVSGDPVLDGADHVGTAEHASETIEQLPKILDKVEEAVVPIVDPLHGVIYSNPLPHVLILTAIVVGVATLAVGLALVVRIREAYGSIEETHIDEAEYKLEAGAK